MQTRVKSVQDTLEQTNLFIIPPFQRAYCWTEEQVKALTNDLSNFAQSTADYPLFLGSIIYLSNKEQPLEKIDGKDPLKLIDGQQRITTIFLLLKAFHEKLDMVLESSSSPSPELCDITAKVKNIIVRNGNVALRSEVFSQTDPNSNYFADIMLSKFHPEDDDESSSGSNNYKDNYELCMQWVDSYWLTHDSRDVYKLINLLLERTILINLELDELDSAIKIFETLNTRGQDLSDSAVFKIILYSNCTSDQEKRDFSLAWDALEEKCQQMQFLKFSLEDIFKDLMSIKLAQNPPKSRTKIYNLREFWLENNYQHLTEQSPKSLLDELNTIFEFRLLPYLSDKEVNDNTYLKDSMLKEEPWFKDVDLLKACYLLLFSYPTGAHRILLNYWIHHHEKPNFAHNLKLFAHRLAIDFALCFCYTDDFDYNLKGLMIDICKDELPDVHVYNYHPHNRPYAINNQMFKDRLCSDYSYNLQAICLMALALDHPKQELLPNYCVKPRLCQIVRKQYCDEIKKRDPNLGTFKYQIGNRAFVYYNNNRAPRVRSSFEAQAEVFVTSNIPYDQKYIRVNIAMNKDVLPRKAGWGGDLIKKIKDRNKRISDNVCELLSNWQKAYDKARVKHLKNNSQN